MDSGKKTIESDNQEPAKALANPEKPIVKKPSLKTTSTSLKHKSRGGKKPAPTLVSGQPQASPPAANGRAQLDPPAHCPGSLTAGSASNPSTPELVQPGPDYETRMNKLEAMLEKVICSIDNPQRISPSFHEQDDLDNVSIYAESELDYTERRSEFRPRDGGGIDPVIDLGDTSSVQNFILSHDDDNFDRSNTKADRTDGRDGGKSSFKIPKLAQRYAAPSGVGEALREDLTESIDFMMGQKLDKKLLDETSARYLCPDNCDSLSTPKVNLTIWDNMKTNTRKRDIRFQMVQTSLLKGITAFAQSLPANSIPTDKQQDALALLCDANFAINSLRKDLIKPDMNPAFHHLCKPQHKVTKLLFGDDLGRQVKEIAEERKTMAGIMRQRFGKEQRFSPYTRRLDSSARGGYAPSSIQPRGEDKFDRSARRSASSNTGQPFLGKHFQKGKFREPPSHTFTPTAGKDVGRHPPAWQNQRR